eukprot:5712486-Alexandrium_andersonii.AAC.1
MEALPPNSKLSEFLELPKRQIASGGRSLNCAGPRTVSKLIPDTPEGCVLHRCFVLISNPTTKQAVLKVPRGFRGSVHRNTENMCSGEGGPTIPFLHVTAR